MAEYRLTPAAERDLESIWTYTMRQRSYLGVPRNSRGRCIDHPSPNPAIKQ